MLPNYTPTLLSPLIQILGAPNDVTTLLCRLKLFQAMIQKSSKIKDAGQRNGTTRRVAGDEGVGVECNGIITSAF